MTPIAAAHEARALEFAAAVRSHLSDLPPAELDDLLDGLHADLAERVAEGDDLGDAAGYAAELRNAAGIPPRRDEELIVERRTLTRALGEWASEKSAALAAHVDHSPGLRSVRDFLVALKPVWWITRALVITWLLLWFIDHRIFQVGLYVSLPVTLLLVAVTVVSVQWGRGKWAANRFLLWVRRIVSAVALLALLPAALWFSDTALQWGSSHAEQPYIDGLVSNGTQITNIYAYSCAGEPIEAVQLFDQNGDPITTLAPWGVTWGWDEQAQQTIGYAPNELTAGTGEWNTFPLAEARSRILENEEHARELAAAPEWPYSERAPLSNNCETPDESASVAGAEDTEGRETDAEIENVADTDSRTDTEAGTETEAATETETETAVAP